MKKSYLLVLLCFYAFTVNAQLPDNIKLVYDKTFGANMDYPQLGWEQNFSLLPDSTIAFAYNTGQEHGGVAVSLISKVDLSGNIVATRPGKIGMYILTSTPSGMVIISGRNGLAAYSMQLDPLWEISIPGFTVAGMKVLSSGTIAAVGVSDDNRTRIAGIISQSGQLIAYRYDTLTNGPTRFASVQEGPDSSFCIQMLNYDPYQSVSGGGYIDKIATRDCQLLQTTPISSKQSIESNLALALPQRKYAMVTRDYIPGAQTATNVALQVADSNLAFQQTLPYSYTYPAIDYPYNRFKLFPDYAGGLFFGQEVLGNDFYTSNPSDEKIFFGQLDQDGQVVFSCTIPATTFAVTLDIRNIIPIGGGDFLVCGSQFYQGYYEARIVRLHKVTLAVKKQLLLAVYPNPASSQLSFTRPDNMSGETVLTISDVMGIVQIRKTLQAGDNKIDINQLKPGNYTLTLRDKENNLASAVFIRQF